MNVLRCDKCHAERVYVGVGSPARRLCACEKGHVCDECGKTATIVEFQDRITGKEPHLPKKSNADVVYFCEADRPAGFPEENATSVRRPPTREESNEGVAPMHHVSRAAQSTTRVECWVCKDVHMLKERKNFNGSYSDCPKCGDDMYTLDMSKDAA